MTISHQDLKSSTTNSIRCSSRKNNQYIYLFIQLGHLYEKWIISSGKIVEELKVDENVYVFFSMISMKKIKKGDSNDCRCIRRNFIHI